MFDMWNSVAQWQKNGFPSMAGHTSSPNVTNSPQMFRTSAGLATRGTRNCSPTQARSRRLYMTES